MEENPATLARGGASGNNLAKLINPANTTAPKVLQGASAPPPPEGGAAEERVFSARLGHPGGRVGKSAATALCRAQAREESADYPAVVAVLNERWRVIACKNSIQWILQRRHGPRWEGRSYCRTREALIRCARLHAGVIDGVALATLLRLPP